MKFIPVGKKVMEGESTELTVMLNDGRNPLV